MGFLSFVLPPAIGAAGVVKLITSQGSQAESLKVGISVLAVVSAGSYFICRKYASSQHSATADDNPEKKAATTDDGAATATKRTDLESIRAEQRSIQTQIQCAVVFSASFLATALSGTSLPASLAPSSPSPGHRLLVSAQSLALAGLVLPAAIVNVGLRRYPDPARSAAVTDGAAADGAMWIPLSFLQNSLEQLLLHVLASLGTKYSQLSESHISKTVIYSYNFGLYHFEACN